MKKYRIIGLMSGTSLDGLDICLCDFFQTNEKWNYEVISATTQAYPSDIQEKLTIAHTLSGEELFLLHHELGRYFGHSTADFLSKQQTHADIIASHGHTIFHQPEKGFTCQIGSGAEIAAITQIETICDFRTKDLALGGQGAPLVPIGDELLFGNYKFCLNIGGIANISVNDGKRRLAWDICAANMLLNHYAKKMGFNFDKDGELSKQGKVDNNMLEELLALDFHHKKRPKSLGREYVFDHYVGILENTNRTIPDILATLTELIAISIKKDIQEFGDGNMLITGGGTYNKALIEKIKREHSNITIPSNEIVSNKEAIIFAFLGLLRKLEIFNTLSSVTGAKFDSIGACIYAGK